MESNGFWIATRGQTIGKRIVGIRVSRSDGSAVGFFRYLILRALPINLATRIPVVGLLLFFVDALMVFNRPRRCLHDYIADTIVVRND